MMQSGKLLMMYVFHFMIITFWLLKKLFHGQVTDSCYGNLCGAATNGHVGRK